MSQSDLDRLFQLPPEEFTAARNELAKRGGSDAASFKRLRKPPVGAWAVNQLYWKRRATYNALVGASEDLRRTHKAVLGGRSADLRAASKAHDEALDAAIKETMELLREGSHPASDSTRQAVISTLRALPVPDVAPGHLEGVLQPGGFEMLSGIAVRGGAARVPPKPSSNRKQAAPKTDKESGKDRARREREEAAAARRAREQEEQQAKRAEFERARAAREAKKADEKVEAARAELDRARDALEQAEKQAAAARRALDALTH